MSHSLQIAKGQSAEILALMADRQEICGRFFLAAHAQNHYGREDLLDMLNSAERRFVPFAQEDGETVVLIQKSRVVGLHPRRANDCDWPSPQDHDAPKWPEARLEFGGLVLEGRAYTGDLPAERSRLADLLNHDNPFFVFETDEGPWIINKNLLNLLVPLT